MNTDKERGKSNGFKLLFNKTWETESKKVISRQNLPTKSPLLVTIVYIQAMSYWNAPLWVWWIMGTVLSLMWVDSVISFLNEEEIAVVEELTDKSEK